MATQHSHEHSSQSNPSNTLTLYDPQSFEAIMTDTPPIATSTVVVANPPAWLIEFHDLINQAYDAALKLARGVPAEHRQSAEIAEQYHSMRDTYITIQLMIKHRVEPDRAQVALFKKDISDASRAFLQQTWKVIASYVTEDDERRQAIDRLIEVTRLPQLPTLRQDNLDGPGNSDPESIPSATRPLGTTPASTSPHVNQNQTSLIEALIKVISLPLTVDPFLLDKPPSYDGKDLSKFRSWWARVKDYIAVYRAYFPDDQIKIIWVGSLLVDYGLDWHQMRARSVEKMGIDDNWSSYTTAIQRRFKDPSERYRNYKKMLELKYKGDTAQYLTEMEGLNDAVKWSGISFQKWPNIREALKGIDQANIDKWRAEKKSCWRCGRDNHGTLNCYANKDVNGKDISTVAKLSATKRKAYDDGEEKATVPKKVKFGALKALEFEPPQISRAARRL